MRTMDKLAQTILDTLGLSRAKTEYMLHTVPL